MPSSGKVEFMQTVTREEAFNLPNLLTLLRIGSVPVLVLLLYLQQSYWCMVAGALFFVSGLTDLLDGFLARRMKKVTVMGKFLDPLADKLLVSSMLVMLVDLDRAPAWMAIVLVGREIGVTGLRAVAASQGFEVPSDLGGKFKTALQMLAVWWLIIYYPVGGFEVAYWGGWVLLLATVLTAYTGLVYFCRFYSELNNREG
jgi:CDP-diacylglycerol--glycerol-3-phosphate 3-phosphatidyltransferase